MQNVQNPAREAADGSGKRSLKERAVSELERYAVISVYLWVLFAVFSLHRQVLQGHGISFWQQGFAIVNALVFGKVILIGEALRLGKSLEKRALAPVVLGKSLIFALLLGAFHIVEETIRALFEGQPLSAAVAAVGGSLASVMTYVAMFFVVLIPFYAFQEAARVLGGHALWDLFFRRRVNRIRLVEDQAIEP